MHLQLWPAVRVELFCRVMVGGNTVLRSTDIVALKVNNSHIREILGMVLWRVLGDSSPKTFQMEPISSLF